MLCAKNFIDDNLHKENESQMDLAQSEDQSEIALSLNGRINSGSDNQKNSGCEINVTEYMYKVTVA
jgi:hypothetical protein